jgi:hypothetical protein
VYHVVSVTLEAGERPAQKDEKKKKGIKRDAKIAEKA